MSKIKKGKKMQLTKIAAVTLSAALIFGCDDLEFKETTSTDTDSGSEETDTGDSSTDDTTSINLGAQILDTLTDDGGELRIKLSDQASVSEIVTGQVSATIQLQEDTDSTIASDGSKNTAYVSLYSDGTSSSNLHGDIIFASDGIIKQRDETGSQIEVNGATYTEGEAIEFVATWDETTYSFSVDGGTTFFGPYASRDETAVTVISFKLGDTSGQSSYEFNVDDITIEDEGVEVFTDSFDDDTEGTTLVPPYNSSSSEATSELMDFDSATDSDETEEETDSVTDDFESYTVGDAISDASSDWSTANIDAGSVAEVSEDQANGGTQSLYLADNDDSKPYAYRSFAGTSTAGSVSVDVYTPSDNTKTTYINVGTGKNNSDRYFEVRLSSSLGYENSTDGDVTLETDFSKDNWHTVTIAWTDADLVTVSLDGTEVATDIDQTLLGLSSDTPTQFTVYTGDSSSFVNSAYFDNLDSDLF